MAYSYGQTLLNPIPGYTGKQTARKKKKPKPTLTFPSPRKLGAAYDPYAQAAVRGLAGMLGTPRAPYAGLSAGAPFPHGGSSLQDVAQPVAAQPAAPLPTGWTPQRAASSLADYGGMERGQWDFLNQIPTPATQALAVSTDGWDEFMRSLPEGTSYEEAKRLWEARRSPQFAADMLGGTPEERAEAQRMKDKIQGKIPLYDPAQYAGVVQPAQNLASAATQPLQQGLYGTQTHGDRGYQMGFRQPPTFEEIMGDEYKPPLRPSIMSPDYEPLTPETAAYIRPETRQRLADEANYAKAVASRGLATRTPAEVEDTAGMDRAGQQAHFLQAPQAMSPTILAGTHGPRGEGPLSLAEYTQAQKAGMNVGAWHGQPPSPSEYGPGGYTKSDTGKQQETASRRAVEQEKRNIRLAAKREGAPVSDTLAKIQAKSNLGVELTPSDERTLAGIEKRQRRQQLVQQLGQEGASEVIRTEKEAAIRLQVAEVGAKGLYEQGLGLGKLKMSPEALAAERERMVFEGQQRRLAQATGTDNPLTIRAVQRQVDKERAAQTLAKEQPKSLTQTTDVTPKPPANLGEVSLDITEAEAEGGIANALGIPPGASGSAVRKIELERRGKLSLADQQAFDDYKAKRLLDPAFAREYNASLTPPSSWKDVLAGVEQSVLPGPARFTPGIWGMWGQ